MILSGILSIKLWCHLNCAVLCCRSPMMNVVTWHQENVQPYFKGFFFWHRLKRDVSLYIKPCHTFQLTSKPNQSLTLLLLIPIPAITQPFENVIIDCVGPLPPSRSGASYLLTVMCQNTRYPAASTLRTITARSVVRAQSWFISFFGDPQVI